MKENDCRKCCVSDFKHALCEEDFCEKYYCEGSAEDFEKLLPHWIPCSNRPPEEDKPVFVYLFYDSPYIAWVREGRWHTEEFMLDKDEEPVAWMPLPAQYEGGRKE